MSRSTLSSSSLGRSTTDIGLDDPLADVILRSCDSIDFRVRKSILSEVSGFFKDMFSLLQPEYVSSSVPGNHNVDGLSVVPVAEDKEALYLFLRLCHPNEDHSISDLAEVRLALKILRKYDVRRTPDSVSLILMFNLEKYPLKVCAIACAYDLASIANAATKASLKSPIMTDRIPSGDLKLMTASQHNAILRYHTRAGTAASNIVTSFQWFESPEEIGLPCYANERDCKCRTTWIETGLWSSPVLNWAIRYQKDLARALMVTPDWSTVVRDGSALTNAMVSVADSGCVHCRGLLEDMPIFTEALAKEVDKAIAAVPLPFAAVATYGRGNDDRYLEVKPCDLELESFGPHRLTMIS